MLPSLFLMILLAAGGTYSDQFDDDLKLSTEQDQKKYDSLHCNIEGTLKHCSDCYKCDSEHIEKKKGKVEIKELKLKDNDCNSITICCIPQNELSASSVRNKDTCGDSNPNGAPSQHREFLRQVLPGQYPWRAWIYKKGASKPICAATLFDENSRSLITLASCVQFLKPESIVVRFKRNVADEFMDVDQVYINDEFKSNEDRDIAVITLRTLDVTLPWIKPICLSEIPLTFATSCDAVSDDDNKINVYISKESRCKGGKAEEEPRFVNTGTLCSQQNKYEYAAETGSALFCLETNAQKPLYYMYGIMKGRVNGTVDMYNLLYDTELKINNWIWKTIDSTGNNHYNS